ncbi:Hypothetical predicted protein [Lecanosticta acicola]|uniref:NTF2-like domain-containing protein n=1 Tax=Lecanosticta acicola TaxID=111012 RepID=A0AAI9EB87_9PEZI|nr:Hypothetical predicted protein [Lecanosticta acicola]
MSTTYTSSPGLSLFPPQQYGRVSSNAFDDEALVCASPMPLGYYTGNGGGIYADVTRLVQGFKAIISQNPVNGSLAAEIIADNFTSISDSVNFVDGLPLNTTMTRTRAELLEQEKKLPAVATVTDLFIANTCDVVTWYFEFGTIPLATRGIAILFVDLATKKIWKAYREVNVGAVLTNQGNPECKSDFSVSTGKEGVWPTSSSCRATCQPRGY